MNIGFIGAGKAGFSLGKFFSEHGVTVTGYYSRHQGSAEEAAAFTHSRAFNSLKDIVDESDALWLTVPDGEITSVYEEICSFNIVGKDIIHCSGAMTSAEAFPDIAAKGAVGLSIHPLFPFSDKYNAYKELTDVFFCVEGERKRAEKYCEALRKTGLKTKLIAPAGKAAYHLACSEASNLVCGLLELSRRHLADCGFMDSEAMEALAPLARANLEHIIKDGPASALSGPVERNDSKTVLRHLAEIKDTRESEVYTALSLILTDLANKKHPEKTYTGLINTLRNGGAL